MRPEAPQFRVLVVPVIGTLAFLFASTASAATWGALGEAGFQLAPPTFHLVASDEEEEDPWEEEDEEDEEEGEAGAPTGSSKDNETGSDQAIPAGVDAAERPTESAVGQESDAAPSAKQAESMGHRDRRDERNAKKALSGGAMLGIGIPVTILGVSLMVPAFYLLGAAITADALGAGGAGGLLFGIPSIILFSLAVPAVVAGVKLIVGGARALSKIEAKRMERRQDRYAMKSQKRVHWGMQVSVAGVWLN